ncbi:MAG: hypothetical protein ACLPX9_18750 [Rhodomicrobium sp.]|jgi:hypothetical protein
MNSGELRDVWTRLQISMETVEDAAVLLGPSDREQAARLTKIATRIKMETVLLGEKIEAAHKAEKRELR